MKKSEKRILVATLALAGLMLGSALLYAAVQNMRAEMAMRDQKAFENSEEQKRLREVEREKWKAYLQTPEGRAEVEKKRVASAAAEEARVKAALARLPAPRPKVEYPMSAREKEDVLAVIVRLTNDSEAELLEVNCYATKENLECIVKFESRQKERLWRLILNRVNGDLWSVADRETGKMIWSMAGQ